jgi:hypothetical protein
MQYPESYFMFYRVIDLLVVVKLVTVTELCGCLCTV